MAISTAMLQRFCACPHSDAREALHRPWVADGRIYASNGWVLIAIPHDGRELPPPVVNPMGVSILASRPTAGYEPVPTLPDWNPCWSCFGTGRVGTSRVGAGGAPCGACDGIGEPDEEENPGRVVGIGGDRFQARLLRLLALLPGAQIAPGLPGRPAGVTFDGDGIGLLMPLKPLEE